MIKLLIKFVIGVLIIPLAVAVSVAFYRNVMLIKELANSMNCFLWGIASYATLHLLFYKPTYIYVLGHEAVHAGMAWVFGGKIKSFKASKDGGSVATDKSNTAIELGPYFIPIYTAIIAFIYFVIAASYNIDGRIFVFLIGFTLAFHIISTVEVMKVRQPDIMKSGQFFSVVFVYLLNIVVISLIFALIFPSFALKNFFIDTWLTSKGVYIGAIKQLFF